MRVCSRDPGNNGLLRETRGISFEDVVLTIELGNEFDMLERPNQTKYPGQRILVIVIEEYAYLVPLMESDEEIFQKTIIPNRRATKQYVGGSNGKAE